MELLVTSQNLCVIQTEFSLYVLLKFWLFLKFHPNWEGSVQDGISCAHKYFKAQGGTFIFFVIIPVVQEPMEALTIFFSFCFQAKSELEFLLRDVGSPYLKAFGGLRLVSLIGHPQDVDMIQDDRIVPASLLLPVFRMQWYRMLQTDQGYDKG